MCPTFSRDNHTLLASCGVVLVSPKTRKPLEMFDPRILSPLFPFVKFFPLPTFSVKRSALERRKADTIDRPHIDPAHGHAVFLSPPEYLHATCLAKEMRDFFGVETVFGEIIFT